VKKRRNARSVVRGYDLMLPHMSIVNYVEWGYLNLQKSQKFKPKREQHISVVKDAAQSIRRKSLKNKIE
jgi:hypothetical protein